MANELKQSLKDSMNNYLKLLEYSLSGSSVRSKIIFLLFDKSMTITEIRKQLQARGESYNYRTIWQHIKALKDMGIVNINKIEHQSGKPVIVSLSDSFPKDEIFKEDFKDIAFSQDLIKNYNQFHRSKIEINGQ